jgi:hypothetical protein
MQSITKSNRGHPITGHEGPTGGVEVSLYSFLTSAIGGGGWSAPRPGRFTPGKYPVPIVQEAGWAPGPVWITKSKVTKNTCVSYLSIIHTLKKGFG